MPDATDTIELPADADASRSCAGRSDPHRRRAGSV